MIDNLRRLEAVAAILAPLDDDFVFLGGAVVPLLVDAPGSLKIRPTQDVDVIVEVLSRPAYYELEHRLRGLGLRHDTTPGAPICRWTASTDLGTIPVDVMPIEEKILGFSNPWYSLAMETAQPVEQSPHHLRLITAPVFLGTKLQAFLGRGRSDYLGSPDLEDVVTLVEGRARLITELQAGDPRLRQFVGTTIAAMLDELIPVISGHISQPSQRFTVIDRFRRLADL